MDIYKLEETLNEINRRLDSIEQQLGSSRLPSSQVVEQQTIS